MIGRVHKLVYVGSMIGIGVAIISLFYMGYLIFWPVKTLTFAQTEGLKIVNENQQVRAGEELFYRVSYCRYTDRQAKVTREVHDGIVYIMPEMQVNLATGCFVDRIVSIGEIPKAIQPGTYSMYITIEFKINSLQTVTHTLTTEPFYVVR